MRIIDSIYDSLSDDEVYGQLPALVADALKARSCVMQVFSPHGALKEIKFSYFTEEMNTYYVETRMYEDDIWSGVLGNRHLRGTPVRLDDHISRSRYGTSRFYNDFFRRFGDDTAQCIGFGAQNAGGDLVTMGFHRAFRETPFSDATLDRLGRLIPHLNRLFAARAALATAQRRAQIAESGLDGVAHAVILADGAGRPLFMNQAAETLAAANDGLSLSNGRIAAASLAVDRKLTHAIAAAAGRVDAISASLLIERPSGMRAYRVLVAPWTADNSSCALIVIDDPDHKPQNLAERLAGPYGLTKAEAQTAALLAQGWRAEEIAEKRKVTLATVRTQIQMALRKTGARGSSELASLIARLPRIHRS